MLFDSLKKQARDLPEQPGVYIMRNRDDEVIYVGKAKKLRNRVSQYFQDTASHTPKTRLMVSHIDHFEVIIAHSEFEALVLEASLIKKYKPKYNILLKDDKGYPFIRIDTATDYPDISICNKVSDDRAEYFGPYGNRGVTISAIKTIKDILKLPTCSKKFPRDIGKERPCLNYHMGLCAGWCARTDGKDDYNNAIDYARKLLNGDYAGVIADLKSQMFGAADDLKFELAAQLRDQLNSVEKLKNKQFVTAISAVDMDVVGYWQSEAKACFSVLHFRNGNLTEKVFSLLPYQDNPEEALSTLLLQYYDNNAYRPRLIVMPFDIPDKALLEQFLTELFSKKVKLHIPQRGNVKRLSELAQSNAYEEIERHTSNDERINASIAHLCKMLDMESLNRIESYDISNISGSDIVGSMVVYLNGRPRKSDYKHFRINGLENQDDYASMYQIITRRFTHFLNGDAGFDAAPDLLLIDGGVVHAQTALDALIALGLSFPVVGMVKDERHRTRALVTPDGKEIGIISNQGVFSLIGNIQEQTHNFAISYHRKLRSKRMQYSQLDTIAGVGEKRKCELIKHFKSLRNIKNASIEELTRVVPFAVAKNIFDAFHK